MNRGLEKSKSRRLYIRQCHLKVMSHKETLGTGTRNAIAESLSLSSGMTLAKHLAAPVDVGIMFCMHPLPSRHNYSNNT